MSTTAAIWLMLAFPGEDVGRYALRAFAPAKNGKSWYRRLNTREAAILCKRELVGAGIRYQCRKIEAPKSSRRSATPKIRGSLGIHAAGTPIVALPCGAGGRRNYDQVFRDQE